MPVRAIPTWVGKSVFMDGKLRGGTGHPHVGGEINSSWEPTITASGPSPRGWGNRSSLQTGSAMRRAIPTWVGKSGTGGGEFAFKTGHPHVGGDIRGGSGNAVLPAGPSPRGWGNPRFARVMYAAQRAIPTWVGKSSLPHPITDARPGHPHVGGEIEGIFRAVVGINGPSPRGWGNLMVCCNDTPESRAIPTWVGKSRARRNQQKTSPGHPHVGGEIKLRF